MNIETERLILIPLSFKLLQRANLRKIEKALGIRVERVGFFERIRKGQIYKIKAGIVQRHPRSLLLSTMWILVDRNDMKMVGEAGFKGPPVNGCIEIGYSTLPQYRCRGYMSEAVCALVKFAFAQTEYHVEKIAAKTLPENYASQSVLKKNHFRCEAWEGDILTWVRNPQLD